MTEFLVDNNKSTLFKSLKQLSKIIQENEDRQSNSISRSNIGVWEWDIQSGNLIWDETMCLIYEVKKSEVSKKYFDWASRVHPEDIKQAEEKLENCRTTIQKNYSSVFRIKHGSEWRFVIAQGFKTYDNENQTKTIIGTNMLVPKDLDSFINLEGKQLS